VAIEDSEIILHIKVLLDQLGPFTANTLRKDKWRTAEHLAYELIRCGLPVTVDQVDGALRRYEAGYRERMKRGLPPEADIRRATYPDRTTALPLWGSTAHLGEPWLGQPSEERLDAPGDLGLNLPVSETDPRVFLSHTHQDAELCGGVAERLAELGIRAWMFEVDIEERGVIANCVREAIASCACCAGLLTRNSIASLWVLTELHTALESKKHVALVVDAPDRLLLALLESVRFQNPEGPFDFGVQYDAQAADKLREDYSLRNSQSRAGRYPNQLRDFLATLPAYLGGKEMLAFPEPPADWAGVFGLCGMEELRKRLA
jgi:hypothetical protein